MNVSRRFFLFILLLALLPMETRGSDASGPGSMAAGAETRLQPPYAAGQQSVLLFSPEVACGRRGEPGGLIRIRARFFSGIDSMSAYLSDPHGRRVARASFFREDPAVKESAWAGLIGVPSTAREGEYLLVVSAEHQARSFLKVAAVSIDAKKFAFERIPLDPALTAILETPDPLKIKESRELAELLSHPHGDAILEWGMLLRPVVPLRKSAGFGDRREYAHAGSRVDSSVHNGIDYALAEGGPVSACGKGKVAMAKERILTGKTVVLEHLPGLYSLYFHLSEIAVKEGEILSKGAAVGKVGRTGFATGPHLHWEVQVIGVPVDPERFFSAPILDKTADFSSIDTQSVIEGR